MIGDAATTVSAVSRCLTGAFAAKPSQSCSPQPRPRCTKPSQSLQVQSVPSLRCITAGRLACARPHRGQKRVPNGCPHWVLAAGPRCRGFLIRVLTPDPSRVRIG